MKNIFLSILCLLLVQGLFAQKKLKFGKISKDDLEMTVYEHDEEAEAVMLEKNVRTQYAVKADKDMMVYDHHIRIKILTKAGLDHANITLPYFSGGDEKILNIKAATYNLENGEVKKIKLKHRDIFEEEVSENVSLKKFTFPNAQVGSIIEYKYSVQSDNVLELNDFYFQEDIPVRRSSYKVKIPHFFTYITIKQVTRPFNVETSKKVNINFGAEYGTSRGIAYSWEMHDVPALKEESFITTVDDYRQRIRLQLKSYQSAKVGIQEIFSTWQDTKKRLMEMKGFGGRLSKSRSIKPVLEEFAASHSKMDAMDKVKAMFRFVQDNVEWNGQHGFFSSRKPKEVLKERSGSVGEINLMLLAMLKYSGIEAYPILLSTRSHGRPNPYYPILKQFNYVVVQVRVEGEVFMLDAVHSYMPFGYVSFKCLNQKGWLMTGGAGVWISIKPAQFTKTTQIILNLDKSGGAEGVIATYYGGYAAIDKRNEINTRDEEEYLQKRIKKNIPNIVVDSIVFKNKKEVDKKLIEKIHFRIADFAEIGGQIMYINPILKEGYEENPFQLKERDFPVDLGYLKSEKIIINVYLPEGYTIDELPESINMILGEDGGNYKFMSSKGVNGSIQIISNLKLKKPIYSSGEYQFIKQFFDTVIEKQLIQLVAKQVKP
jgi:transglutaminase-like putative cysteine protease